MNRIEHALGVLSRARAAARSERGARASFNRNYRRYRCRCGSLNIAAREIDFRCPCGHIAAKETA